jgi:DNA helicase II / ATP-dependent DNA helicase PcrA
MSNTPNAQQLQAIKHIDGVMRVLAGPGTGKTEVLGQRIANLLQSEAQIAPEEILCITYTEAGRIAMRDRLTKIMGSDTAQKVNIHTYHSFCNEIIQNNKMHFNREDLEQVTQLEQITLVHQLIDSLPPSHLFKQTKDPYRITYRLLKFFGNIKAENLKIDELLNGIDNYIERDLPLDDTHIYKVSRGDKKKGDYKQTYYELIEKLQRTKTALALYEPFQTMMHDAGRYDFDDMIHWVIQLFEKNEQVLANYWERYQYILVDEYQDTNGAQNKLIELLCSHSADPNLFVVGDDDQSIFKFQGANAENMRMLEVLYGNTLQDITLTDNYRSQQKILDSAEKLISKNTTRIKPAGNALNSINNANPTEPVLCRLDTTRHEFAFIALQIQELILNKKVAAREIAVILRKNKQCLQLAKYLKHIDIPYYTETDQNLLEMPFMQQIINMLTYINAENMQFGSGDEILFKILHAPFFGVPAFHIAKANYSASILREPYCSLREYLNTKYANETFANEKLIAVNTVLESLINDANSFPLYKLFRTLVEKCKLHAHIMQQANSLELLDQLTALFNWLEAETDASKDMTIEELILNVQLLKENNEKINFNSKLGTRNGVQILTVFKSKGLEYEYVFVPSCTASQWDKGRNDDGFTLPKTITSQFASKHIDDNSKADELRRLMFVALTRAKKEVTVSYNAFNEKGKEEAMSQLISQVFSNAAIEQASQNAKITAEQMALFEPIDLVSDKPLQIAQAKEDFINRQVASLEMNATALNNYIKCPLRFYFNNILRMPSGINENLNFGTAIHDALDYYFRDMLANNNTFSAVEVLHTLFEKTMFKYKRNFTKEGFKQKLEYGKIILSANYKEYINNWEKNVLLEWKPKAKVVFESIPLTAKVDKLEFITDTDVVIIDYKTGDVEGDYAKANIARPNEKKNKGGDYWRQAVFYKIFIDIAESKWHFNSAKFVYVEPSKKDGTLKNKPIVITAEDEQIVKQQITNTWQNIQDHNFYTGCNESDCAHCNFVKDNNLELQ